MMDPIFITLIVGVCGLVCAGFMAKYVLGQPQTIEVTAEASEYVWSAQDESESAVLSTDLSQDDEEALTLSR
jgi:ABC-type polysaccharide transport system permease subunit